MNMEDPTPVKKSVVRDTVAACDLGNRLPRKKARIGCPDPLARVSALVRMGRYAAAATAVQEFLLTDPHNLAALEILAKMQWQTCRMQAVVDTTRRLIVLKPYEPGYHVLQASALQCLGRYGEAARSYQRAGDSPEVQDAVDDLNAWQGAIVAEMLSSDAVFRAHYAQNPADACAARGFSFLGGTPVSERWIVGSEKRESLFTRPS
jgi:tetratricopeptide (TPR) repeat protein